MRGLTLWQPWATLVVIRAKVFETRSWRTDYTGPLAIHAAKGFPVEAKALCLQSAFYRPLMEAGYMRIEDLPLGAILGTVDLAGCLRTEHVPGYRLLGQERLFGDFTDGRWAWMLDEVQRADPPLPYRGAQGLWLVPLGIAAELTRRGVTP